jgi:surface carbohydrate biosynthesis protein (TIGR04326 family)
MPSAVAVTVLWALKTLVIVPRTSRKLMTPDAAEGPRAVWIYSWIEPRCFTTPGRFTDPWTGRLEDILSAQGERVQRLTPLEIPSGLLPWLTTSRSRFILTPRALTLRDVFRAVFHVFWIHGRRRVAAFRGWDYSPLLWREQLREWGQPHGAHCRMFYAVMRRIARRHRHVVKCLIYPFENQPWEKLFCLAWREQAPDVTLIGYQHSWVPSLLLPYALGATERETLPLPDRIVTNSPFNHRALITGGFPEAKLVNGGALRHEYLHAVTNDTPRNASQATPSSGRQPRMVLVVFPLHEAYANGLLTDLLEEFRAPLTVEGLTEPVRFLVKLHPSLPLNRFYRHSLALPPWIILSDQPTREGLAQADLLLYAGPTSTWWEAALSGVPVVKYQPDLLDIDAGQGLPGLRVERCTRATLRATLCRVLQGVSQQSRSKPSGLEEVFSKVDEEVWRSLVRSDADCPHRPSNQLGLTV